ncbi:MAG: DpnI domain-containing protein [Patescibacteria group bacterium]
MSKSKDSGDNGELDVVNKVPCPNCNKKLMLLPKNYPLYDTQCIGCNFRAQIKTNHSKPKKEIFGAGWDIMEKVLKSGFITPPIITNFIWKVEEKQYQEIRFYPFIPKKNLKMHQLSPKARRANYKMFNYIGIDKLPYFILYQYPK